MTALLEHAPAPVRWVGAGVLAPAETHRIAAFALAHSAPIDHVRCVLSAARVGADEPAVVAEALRQAVEANVEWAALARDTGVALRPRVLAGQATLSFTSQTAHTVAAVEKLASLIAGLTWQDLAMVTSRAVAAITGRSARVSPRHVARRLCTTPVGDGREEVDGVRDEGLHASFVVLLSAAHRTQCEPSDSPELPVEDLRLSTRLTHRPKIEGSGRQAWIAWTSELPQRLIATPRRAHSLAAAQLAFFTIAGSPASPVFRTLRDELGISYGPRSDVQVLGRTAARGWIEISVPSDHVDLVNDCVQTEFQRVVSRPTADLVSSAPVLRTSLRAVLDAPSGQADAIVAGLTVHDPWHAWRMAEALDRPDALRSLISESFSDMRLDTTGIYQPNDQGGAGRCFS